MNSDQVMMTIRTVLTIVGPLLVTKGLVSSTGLDDWTNNMIALAGAALPVATWIWGLFAHSATGKIASVNATPGVKVVAESAPAQQVSAAPTPDDAKIAAVNAIDGVKVVKDTVSAPIVTTPPKTS